MKTRRVANHALSDIRILEFGHESISKNARWGKSRRNIYILHYVLSGTGYFNGNPVRSGEGFLIKPMISAEYHPSEEAPWKYFWMSFEGDSAEKICTNHIRTNEHGIFEYNFTGMLTSLVGKLFREDAGITEIESLSIFYQVIANHEAPEKEVGNRYVNNAKSYIEMNYHRTITVTEVAAEESIDDRYLYNLFIKHEGISPKQYITGIRIQNAKKLLASSNCTVTEVAASVGFSDVLAFSRFFKKQTSLSPKEYRASKRI